MRRLPTLLALLVLAGAVDCRQVAGIDDRERAGSSLCKSSSGDACGECTEAACCNELAACNADSACASAWYCLEQCAGDDACRAACKKQHPGGAGALLNAALACQGASCAAQCSLACGGYVYNNAACAACMTASDCCGAAETCASDPGCLDLHACLHACSSLDTSCVGACLREYPASYDAAEAFSACNKAHCVDVCGDGAQWGCVGKATPQPATGPVISYSLRVMTQNFGAGIPDLDVRACDPLDVDCSTPIGTSTTGADGTVAFQLPSGFAGYFEITSQATPPAFVHSLLYTSAPMYSSSSVAFTGFSAAQLDLARQTAPAVSGTALLLIHVNDCIHVGGAGITFGLDGGPGASGFYMRNGVPTTASASVSATDDSGDGGFVNVPTSGGVVARWDIHATGEPLAAAQAIAVRPDSVTYVWKNAVGN